MRNIFVIFFILSLLIYGEKTPDLSLFNQLREDLQQQDLRKKTAKKLLTFMQSSSRQVCVLATEVIKPVAGEEYVWPTLLKLVRSSNKNTQILAMEALSHAPKKKVFEVLRQKLSHSDPYVIGNAAIALGKLNDNESVSVLKELVLNKSLYRYARIMPALALLNIQGSDATNFLLEQLEDEDPYLRYSIIENLSRLKVDHVQEALKEHISKEKQLFILHKLREVFPKEFETLPILNRAVTDNIENGLELSISGPRLIFFKRNATYTIKIKNRTKQDFLDYKLKLLLPVGLDFLHTNTTAYQKQPGFTYYSKMVLKDDPQKELDAFEAFLLDRSDKKTMATLQEKKEKVLTSTNLTWIFAKIPAQKEISIEVSVLGQGPATNIIAVLQGKLHNIKKLWYSTVIMCIPAFHISTYDTEDPLIVGKQTIYIVEARNEGTSDVTNVKILNIIPKEMEFISASGPSQWRWLKKQRAVLFESVPVIPAGEKCIYKIVCKALTPGSFVNRAAVLYDQFDKPIIDEEGTSIYGK